MKLESAPYFDQLTLVSRLAAFAGGIQLRRALQRQRDGLLQLLELFRQRQVARRDARSGHCAGRLQGIEPGL